MEAIKNLRPKRLSYESLEGYSSSPKPPSASSSKNSRTHSRHSNKTTSSGIYTIPELCIMRAFDGLRKMHFAQIFLQMVTVILCLCAGQRDSEVNFGQDVNSGLMNECLLFAKIQVTRTANASGSFVPLSWGNKSSCSFIEFGLYCSGILAALLSWMMILIRPNRKTFCKRGSSGVEFLMLGAMVFAVIGAIFALIISSYLSSGVATFCKSFQNVGGCYKVRGLLETWDHGQFKRLSTYIDTLLVTQVLTWCACVGWLCVVGVVSWRMLCRMDFNILSVNMNLNSVYISDSDEVSI